MDASVTMDYGMRFKGTADTGHEIYMDASPDVGGHNTGSRPMEVLLMGLCGCTAMDVISILRKKRQAVTGLQVKAQANQKEDHPRVFTDIHLHYIVRGIRVDPKAIERSIQLSAERYCPAQAMLGQIADMTTSFELIDEE